MDSRPVTDEERLIAKVWDYLCAHKVPTNVKVAFRELALTLLDDAERANLKHWQPSDDECAER